MNASKPPATAGQAGSGQPAKKRYQWKPWKIAAVAFAGLLLVGGGALALTAGSAEPTTKSGSQDFGGTGPGGTGGPETARSLTGGATGTGIQGNFEIGLEGQPTADSNWSPALLRGGVSFFVTFCLAFALRSFLRLAAIFIGIWALSVFLMSHAGWVTVDWNAIDSQFTGWTHNLGAQFQSLQTFIKGSLPSTGLAGLGLFTGFKAR